ncbi:ATP-binding cassette domain-containing protein [Luteimicrobium subarcticum]|nr:ABC transporter ATP-binding protein [Luteimicrobium subarcticum]
MTLTPTADTHAPDPDRTAAARPASDDPARRVDWRRLRSRASLAALLVLVVAAVLQTLGTVVAGRLAEQPTGRGVVALLVCAAGSAVLFTGGSFVWSTVADRAEGRLRTDLLAAALHQPLETLTEQAVGEVLDRVDDDTHEIGSLVRLQVWMVLRTAFALVPMWVVAGLTWWPSWFVFPLMSLATWWLIRGLLPRIAERKVLEEMAWTDHAAALEEGVAGADDLRTSLGQPFAVRRLARLSAVVHERFERVVDLERLLTRRAGLLLYSALSLVGIAGVELVSRGSLSVAQLVTLFLVTTTFVGQFARVAEQLPDIQAGLGAVVRIRQMFAAPVEPVGGRPVPDTGLDLELRALDFAYAEGTFRLHDVNLTVPAGRTVALLGRTGSGKSTLASLVSRAVEPPAGTVLLGGEDVLDLDLHDLRTSVGTVTQRTEILAGTLAENITLFADVPRAQIQDAVATLGLAEWVAGLPDGLDTTLGPGGTKLSAGEEQLVAFARLLVSDVRVVVLDEATARMDPLTEARVVAASQRLLAGRTGILVAHRLTTVARADLVAVLDGGRVVQTGPRAELAAAPGPFRDLLRAGSVDGSVDSPVDGVVEDAAPSRDEHPPGAASGRPGAPRSVPDDARAVGGRRRTGTAPVLPAPGDGPSLARGIAHALVVRPAWGLVAVLMFTITSLFGALGAVTGLVWGTIVQDLQAGTVDRRLDVLLILCLLIAPVTLAVAVHRYPRWWIEVLLRVRMSVLVGQTGRRRLTRTPPGEVVARAMDADRFARYADRWVDFSTGLVIAVVTAVAAGTAIAGLVLLAVMVASALASALGRPVAGRSAARSSAARARFGRSLVSALESARTVKLAGRTPQVHAHLQDVDSGRVRAAVFEHRVQALLDGVPVVMVQLGVVAAWAAYLAGVWDLAVAILVANAVNGFDWFGRVAGAVVTEAPGTRAWQRATARLAGGGDLMDVPDGVDLVTGDAPAPPPVTRTPLQRLELSGLDVVHEDGTVGVSGVDLVVQRGELVLLLGQVGSGKSSLLSALAGLLPHTGAIRWNDRDVTEPEVFLRPGQVAHIAQAPRVLSGTFADNVRLGHERELERPVDDARLGRDVEDAGGLHAVVGHRGVRLSGGQVQRLALARALAADTELLLADDVSSALDATTEVELWRALRARRTTVIGSTSKRAALAQADRVVVLVDGRVAATGPWSELAPTWGSLAG